MKILHATTHWVGGGSERNIAHTLECLRDAGHDVHLAYGHEESDAVPIPAGIRVHRLPSLGRALRPLRDLRSFLAIRRLLRRERFDVVHTHLAKAGFLGRLAALTGEAKVIHTVHNAVVLQRGIYRRLERLAGSRTDAFVFVGNDLQSAYARAVGVDAKKAHLVRSPIAVDVFLAVRERPVPVFDRPGMELRAVLVSRVVRNKGVSIIPEILAAVPQLVLDVAGEGELVSALEHACRTRGLSRRIRFHGHVPRSRVADLIGASHVLLHISPSVEGLPQAIVQALTAGRPVVAVASLGVREVIAHDENGLVATSSAGVASSLAMLCRDPTLLARLTAGAVLFDPSPWTNDEACARQMRILRDV